MVFTRFHYQPIIHSQHISQLIIIHDIELISIFVPLSGRDVVSVSTSHASASVSDGLANASVSELRFKSLGLGVGLGQLGLVHIPAKKHCMLNC